MRLKYSTEEIVEKFKVIHKDKYDYSKFEYLGSNKKSTIICSIHGEFLQIPKTHLLGQGCIKCGKQILHKKFRLSTSEFIKKAQNVHQDKYDYSTVIYYNGNTPIQIICIKHGKFSQRPYDHLSGKGCYKCGRESLIKNRKTHDFTKTRWIELSKNKLGYFYCFKFSNDKESFYKLGITTNLKNRHKRIKSYTIELIDYIVSSNLEYIWNLELQYKTLFKNIKYVPSMKFSGSNECYNISNKIINQIINDKTVCCN